MEAIPLPVRCASALAAVLLALTLMSPAAAEEQYVQEDVRIYYDATVEPHLLYTYKLRILVVSAPVGVDDCWRRLPNGTVQALCRPVANATVKVWYLELKELRVVRTGADGVAEAEFRLMTPTATFKVQVYSDEGYGEAAIPVKPRPWMLLTILGFSAMMAVLTYSVRRGMW